MRKRKLSSVSLVVVKLVDGLSTSLYLLYSSFPLSDTFRLSCFAVAERVIKKGEEHMIGKNAFNVRSFAEESIKTCNKKLSEENHVYSEEFEHIDFVVSEVLRTAEIHGEIDKLSVDTLSLYLESKKSGGGHIEKLDVSVSPALVTFKEVAGKNPLIYIYIFCRRKCHKTQGCCKWFVKLSSLSVT